MDTNEEVQDEELLALQAIFSEEAYLKLNSNSRSKFFQHYHQTGEADNQDLPTEVDEAEQLELLISGDFSAHVHVPESFYIQDFQGDKPTSDISYLPPIVLGFELPKSYPALDPPKINLSCKWLTSQQLTKLITRLDELWKENEHDPILYIWFDFLQNDSLKILGFESCLLIQPPDKVGNENTDSRVIQEIVSNNILFNLLIEHNKEEKQLVFERASWPCAVCFEDRLGINSFRFHGCGHIFCKDCMTQHFTVRIEAGDVKQLTCPQDECESQGLPSQLKDLLSNDLYERYERLLLQSTLDTMLDITYCPRNFCQTAVLLDPESTMGSCTACYFVFCTMCKMSYHGIHPCNIRTAELKKKLEDASEEDIDAYVERYGKQFVEALIRETASYAWIDKNTEGCPVCHVAITKADGCNKMTCTKCKAFFCWLCKAVLPRGNPYAHYRDNSNCILFPGENDIDVVFEDEDLELLGIMD